MKKLLFLLFVLCPLLCLGQNRVSVSATPPMRDAVSGHYAGWIKGNLWTWGGCNFPDVPCADGGEKKYYPIAYGASVPVPGGVAILGGTDGITSFDKCGFYSASDRNYAEIAPLPKGLDNFAATYHDGMLWVAGGQCQGVPNKEVYSLPWPGDAKEWTLAATLPDECRLQSCVAVQGTAKGNCLFVFGGYQSKNDSLGLAPAVHTDGVYMSIAELKKGGADASQWKRTSPASVWVDSAEEGTRELCRQAIVGSTSTSIGYSHVAFFGGVDFEIFLSAIQGRQDSLYLRHEPEWYRFRKDVLTYHTITDAWGLLPGDSLLARAGACLTPEVGGTGWSYSGGELMPGVRSADVTHVEVTNEKNFGWLNWTVLALYLLAMLGMGFYFMRKENGADVLVAGSAFFGAADRAAFAKEIEL